VFLGRGKQSWKIAKKQLETNRISVMVVAGDNISWSNKEKVVHFFVVVNSFRISPSTFIKGSSSAG
jgi:hypothetical protein